jgi:hypothetical protein
MKLTTEQLAEIRLYIFEAPRYRETYYEIYDHIVNALEQADEPFNMDLVKQIVQEDFGGFQNIIHQEDVYRKSVTSKYARLLGSEMIDSFRNSTVLSHLAILILGYMFYQGSEIDLKPLTISMLIF